MSREAEYQARLRRTRGRTAANLLGILTGHLPAPVQERMGSELGILPTRLTALSLLLPMTLIGFMVYENVDRIIKQLVERERGLWPEVSIQFVANGPVQMVAADEEYLAQILRITEGNVTQAARLAKRNRTEFYKLLQRHQLDPKLFKAALQQQ